MARNVWVCIITWLCDSGRNGDMSFTVETLTEWCTVITINVRKLMHLVVSTPVYYLSQH